MPGVRLTALLLAAVSLQQAPVFRGGVDLVTVDVVVLDRSGAPVADLTAADFTIEAGGKPRRLVSAEYIRAATGATTRTAVAAAAPAASSNTRQPATRTFIFVVDVENILAGDGRLAMQGIGRYLDRLPTGDRVGLVALPTGTPRIDPTTDRAVIREAVQGLIGISMRLRDREMTFGEAVGIAARDRSALAAYWYRIVDQGRSPIGKSCDPPDGPFEAPLSVPQVCLDVAERVLDRARYHTRTVLDSVRALATAMAPLAGPKAIVLVSGGAVTDGRTMAQLHEFSDAAARARVSVHSLFLEAPPVEASAGTGPTTQTKRFDNQVGLAGVSDIALAARGAAQRILGDATVALERIDRELSGYYLLAFERDAADRAGERVGISVRTRRDGLRVVARQEFTAIAAPPAPVDARAAVAALLQSPVAALEVPLDVDVYTLPAGGGDEARAIVAIDIGREAASVGAMGFQIADPSGKVVADGFESPARAQARGSDRAILLPSVALRPGHYIARLAVLDTRGQGGSVQHAFEIPAWSAGTIRVSDLILGEVAGGDIRPIALVLPAAPSIAVRLVVRDQAARFDGVTVRLEMSNAVDGAVIGGGMVPLQPTPDALRRLADVELGIGKYPRGEYLVTAVVSVGAQEIARRRRVFRR